MVSLILGLWLKASLEVSNFEAGQVVRYPMVILRGTCPGTDIITGTSWKKMTRFPTKDEKFVATVELQPGKNMVLLKSANQLVKFRLDYKPMTTPYKVRSVYLASADETTDYDAPPGVKANMYGEKLDTTLKMLQGFTADAMKRGGYDRKTFALEFDKNGKVKVNVVRSPKTGAELRKLPDQELYAHFNDILSKQFNYSIDKCCAIMSFSRYDKATKKAQGHTALGGGGLGLFGGLCMVSWPTSINEIPTVFANPTPIDDTVQLDDSAFRSTVWGLAATTMGAVMHEMGHTFGLPHATDPECIMSRGFDHINRAFSLVEPPTKGKTEPFLFTDEQVSHYSKFFAARLNWHAWFQPDGLEGKTFPSIAPTIKATDNADEIVISSPNNLRVVGAEWDDKPSFFLEMNEGSKKQVSLSKKELIAKVGNNKVSVYAMDEYGNEAHLEIRAIP